LSHANRFCSGVRPAASRDSYTAVRRLKSFSFCTILSLKAASFGSISSSTFWNSGVPMVLE
jgi:hypothetical protein